MLQYICTIFSNTKKTTWTCSKCSLTYLPFANIDNDNFKQTLHALDKQKTRDKLDILPSFKIRTLLDKMPKQTVGFDDLYHNGNSSTYYDIPQFTNKNFNDKTTFGTLHTNIASLQKHHDALCTLLENLQYNFKLIGTTETGIKEGSSHTPINIPNYTFYQTKTTTSKGGTALYVLDSLTHKERTDLNIQLHGKMESTFIEIEQNNKKNIVCGSIYRHPTSNVEDFITYMVKILDKLIQENKIILLMGDFNLNLLNYQSNTDVSNFYDSISSFMLQPLILQPTRVSEKSQTLIDNIFSNNCQYNSVSGNLISKISDHFPQFSILQDFSVTKKMFQSNMVVHSENLTMMNFC